MTSDRPVPAWTSPYRLIVALRLLRTRKINFISIVGVMMGVASIIVVMSVMDGFQRDVRDLIRGTLSDMLIELDSERDIPYAEVKKELEKLPEIEAVTLQLHTYGLIPVEIRESDGAPQKAIPVRIVGILPADERRVSRILDFVQGAYGQPEDPFEVTTGDYIPGETPRVLVSDWIAERVGYSRMFLSVGDEFSLVTFEEREGPDGTSYQANTDRPIVSRIYKSGNSEFDKMHIYVDLTATRSKFFRQPQQVITELRIKLRDYTRARSLSPAIARVLAPWQPGIDEPIVRPGQEPIYLRIETWEDRQRNLLLAVNNEKFILAFVLFFIVIVACFTIFATLTMTVAEKTRDIGVLRALGATPTGILSIFVLNGTLVGTLGAALGYGVGMLVADNVNPIRGWLRDTFGWDIFPPGIYLFDEIPTWIDHKATLLFAGGAVASALVFAIIPAIRAARLRPVRALRYE